MGREPMGTWLTHVPHRRSTAIYSVDGSAWGAVGIVRDLGMGPLRG